MAKQSKRDLSAPSPQEIQAACQNIQRGWSPSDFERRAGIKPQPYSVPTINTSELSANWMGQSVDG